MSRSQSTLESHLTKAKAPQRQSYVIGCQYMYFKTQSPGIQTSQGDKKESFSVKACYVSKIACWYFARTEQEGSIPRAAQHTISLTPCPVAARGSLDFCFLSLLMLIGLKGKDFTTEYVRESHWHLRRVNPLQGLLLPVVCYGSCWLQPFRPQVEKIKSVKISHTELFIYVLYPLI